MTFPNEKAEIRAHEIEKTKAEIQVLTKKLYFLEDMQKRQKSPAEIAFKRVYGHYPDTGIGDGRSYIWWDVFQKGYNAAYKEKVSEVEEQGTWNYDPDAKFRKQEQVNTLQEKEWTYKVTDEKGETNPYKQYLNNVDTEEYPYKKYTPEETEKSLKDAMKTAKSEGVFDEPKPKPLTLKQLLKKWEIDFAANWAILKNRDSELYEEEVERFIQMFTEWMPDANKDYGDGNWEHGWNTGYNAYHNTLMEKLK